MKHRWVVMPYVYDGYPFNFKPHSFHYTKYGAKREAQAMNNLVAPAGYKLRYRVERAS